MKRKEEIAIIVDALSRNGLIDTKKIDNVREIVKGALVEIRCRKYAQGQVESPKSGEIPLVISGQVFDKEVSKEVFRKPTLSERVSILEKRLELVKDCVNEGKQIDLFWPDE